MAYVFHITGPELYHDRKQNAKYYVWYMGILDTDTGEEGCKTIHCNYDSALDCAKQEAKGDKARIIDDATSKEPSYYWKKL
ncbi:hypothetical protein LCGC14_0351820 [marine sediment metagenome]|uniref:Uncharacterized protein n=1 Tax=marine sediment metagenome TaxID=412755 RepID=A0A0F9WIS6_9ZZZZ